MELSTLHLFALALSALVILYSDHQAYLYFRGIKKVLSPSFVTWSHRLVWVGLAVLIATGVSLTIPRYEFLLTNPIFYVKMGFVLVLVFNAYAIGTLSHLALARPFADLTNDEKRVLFVSGSLSVMGWVGATIIGFFFH